MMRQNIEMISNKEVCIFPIAYQTLWLRIKKRKYALWFFFNMKRYECNYYTSEYIFSVYDNQLYLISFLKLKRIAQMLHRLLD